MTSVRAQVRRFTIGAFTAEVSLPQPERGAVTSAFVEWTPRVPRLDIDFDSDQRAEYQRELLLAITEVGL